MREKLNKLYGTRMSDSRDVDLTISRTGRNVEFRACTLADTVILFYLDYEGASLLSDISKTVLNHDSPFYKTIGSMSINLGNRNVYINMSYDGNADLLNIGLYKGAENSDKVMIFECNRSMFERLITKMLFVTDVK